MTISMAHGSGGYETEQLIRQIFFRYFNDERLNRMEDAAVFPLSGQVAMTTDSFVVTPLFFRGGDIGMLSVCGTVNDLLMMGAQPQYLTAGFILEEGLRLDMLERIVASMAAMAQRAGVAIVAGDTKVVQGSGGMYINTAGIGAIPQGRQVSPTRCRAGDALLLSGNLGDHHACILSARMRIENDIQSDAAPLGALTEALFAAGIDIKAMRDVTRGGLATVVREISHAAGLGAQLNEAALPVAASTRALCDILGLDVLYMGNEGKLLAVVDAQQAQSALSVLRRTPGGEHAAIVGHLRADAGVALKTYLGGVRTLGPLYGEGLPRIC
ncbi:MAG: hydrogenase expression/formation protein HypE [Eubacteriales bacterium]|nr:hydrogenase expression/formation protein HypE [Eubacteriales bacterium]